jgi:hypothetical protein
MSLYPSQTEMMASCVAVPEAPAKPVKKRRSCCSWILRIIFFIIVLFLDFFGLLYLLIRLGLYGR